MFTYVVYVLAITGLIISFVKDKTKTKKALGLALKSFENLLPQFIAILIIIAFALTVLDTEQISRILGKESGALGLVIGAGIGSVTLIPPYVALPLIASLLQSGAGYAQITIFLTTLTTVGVITLPVEIKYLGRNTAIRRNFLALVFSSILALIMGLVMT